MTNMPMESGRRAKRSRCPDCNRKDVTVRYTRMDGDMLKCRHCEWFAFINNYYP